MSRPPHPLRLYNSNYTWLRVQIMKLLVMQLSPPSCHPIPLWPKYPCRFTSGKGLSEPTGWQAVRAVRATVPFWWKSDPSVVRPISQSLYQLGCCSRNSPSFLDNFSVHLCSFVPFIRSSSTHFFQYWSASLQKCCALFRAPHLALYRSVAPS
jgi:hypothetical protein